MRLRFAAKKGDRSGLGRLARRLIPLALIATLPGRGEAQSLKGSRTSVDLQARIALEHDFTFLTTGRRVEEFAKRGLLLRVSPSRDLELHGVSYPYARPEVALFASRLAAQHRAACGERLVVTSLTRPVAHQPANASERSVHPAGMALDIRYSTSAACRKWLEGVLLALEKRGVVEATRERFPPHYHVAVFPRQYRAYLEELERRGAVRVASPARPPSSVPYRVRRGDTLWAIARAHGTSVAELRSRNKLRTSQIVAGQLLEVPLAR